MTVDEILASEFGRKATILGPNRRSSTGVRGVTLRANGRYEARLADGDRKMQVGDFESLEEAAEAIRSAREELWGEFAGNE